MRHYRIRTKFNWNHKRLQLGGWFEGKKTYLWIGDEAGCGLATLEDGKLYRLAKAIVNAYEKGDR